MWMTKVIIDSVFSCNFPDLSRRNTRNPTVQQLKSVQKGKTFCLFRPIWLNHEKKPFFGALCAKDKWNWGGYISTLEMGWLVVLENTIERVVGWPAKLRGIPLTGIVPFAQSARATKHLTAISRYLKLVQTHKLCCTSRGQLSIAGKHKTYKGIISFDLCFRGLQEHWCFKE